MFAIESIAAQILPKHKSPAKYVVVPIRKCRNIENSVDDYLV